MSDTPTKQLRDWWQQHANLLAKKMKQSGIKMLHIERADDGTYRFSLEPETSKEALLEALKEIGEEMTETTASRKHETTKQESRQWSDHNQQSQDAG